MAFIDQQNISAEESLVTLNQEILAVDRLTAEYQENIGFGATSTKYAKIIGKTIYWYTAPSYTWKYGANCQNNLKGVRYRYFAIG